MIHRFLWLAFILALVPTFGSVAAAQTVDWRARALAVASKALPQSAPSMMSSCTDLVAGSSPENSFEGWDGVVLKRCEYVEHDTVEDGEKCADQIKPGTLSKPGLVYILPLTMERIAQWVVSACADSGHGQDALVACAKTSASWIKAQSEGQFPVAGTVWEALPSFHCVAVAFMFRDGVTVRLAPDAKLARERLDRGQLALRAAPKTPVFTAGDKARIASTTPQEWVAAFGGDIRVLAAYGGDWYNWSAKGRAEIVRIETRAALTSNSNRLVEAWVRSCVKADGLPVEAGCPPRLDLPPP